MIASELDPEVSYNSVRFKYKRMLKQDPDYKNNELESEIEKEFETQKLFTNAEILKLHNLSPDEFKIKTIKRNKWSTTNSEGDRRWNYQSTIIAEPITHEILTPEKIAQLLTNIKPRSIPLISNEVLDNYLAIPLSDMHFGWNSLKDYENLLFNIVDRIKDGYAEILITLHGDFFHVDNLLGTTEKGTKVDDVDLEKGIEDGFSFLSSIIESSLENSPCVKLVFLTGNHSPSIDLVFTKGIKRLYQDLEVDDEVSEYKHSWLGEHSIFMHHGDKIKDTKRLLEVIVSEFSREWGDSQSRYLITGHYHHEKTLSLAGLTHYQVQSPSKSTNYDKKYGYVTSETGMMLFEFDKNKRTAIYYL